MTDVVETALDVALQYPFRGFSFVQVGEALLDCIMGASADSEPVGIGVGVGFRYRLQRKFVECLHGSVGHSRDAQRTHFPVFLGNIVPSERLRAITPPVKF